MNTTLYEIANRVIARANCLNSDNYEWLNRHEATIDKIVCEVLPHGSGFDGEMRIDFERSSDKELVFITDFHHMNDGGYYDGWTGHTVKVTPSFLGFDVIVTGENRNDIQDYIAECFHDALTTNIEIDANNVVTICG